MGTIIGVALWALIPGFMAKKKGRNFWGYYFLSFLVSPLISMIIVACLKNLNVSYDKKHVEQHEKKENNSQEQVDDITSDGENDSNTTYHDLALADRDTLCFCRKCGNQLLKGAVFCNKCGFKVSFDDE